MIGPSIVAPQRAGRAISIVLSGFDAARGPVLPQAVRFAAVSVATFVLTLGLLAWLAGSTTLPALAAQALATVAVTPISFAGGRLWAFGSGST